MNQTPAELKAIAQVELLDSLRKIVSYDAESGRFTWLVQSSWRCVVGSLAGTISAGRRYITIANRKYGCNRLAWFFMTGAMPEFEIDHRDGDKLNDRFSNLRDVTRRVNGENMRSAKSHNTIGVLGVRINHGAYCARIVVKGKEIDLGRFATVDEASKAYIAAKREYHEGCTI